MCITFLFISFSDWQSTFWLSLHECHPIPLTTLAPLLNISQAYRTFIEVGMQECVHYLRCWCAVGLIDRLTMLPCFSLLLSRFLYWINMMKGWHYVIGVCPSLNSMKGEQPLRCKLSPFHLQKSWWQTHCPISFWFTNIGFISSFWTQILVNLIYTSHKASQQKGWSLGWQVDTA